MDQMEAAQRDFLDASGAGMPTRREASRCCRFAAMPGRDSRRLLPGWIANMRLTNLAYRTSKRHS
jgi:hypothetical protein